MSLIRGMRRRPRRKAIAMGLMGDMGLMGVMGLMGEEVVSLVVLSVSDWVRWWVWSEVRSREVIFSRSRLVVRRVVSPVSLVWMVIVVVSLMVSWSVRVTVSITVSWTVSLWVCCVTVLLLLQLANDRASVAMRAVVNPLYCISQMVYFGA